MVIALVATAFFLPTTPPTGRRTSLADPFRALRHKPLLLIALTAVFYNIGFFTILAAGPFALPNSGIIQIGWIYFGWGAAARPRVGVRRAAACSARSAPCRRSSSRSPSSRSTWR